MFLLDVANLFNSIGYWFWDTGMAIATVWWVGPALAGPFIWVAYKFWDLHYYTVRADVQIEEVIQRAREILTWDNIKQRIGWEFPGIWQLFDGTANWIRRRLSDWTQLSQEFFDRPWDYVIRILCDHTGLETGFFHYPINWIQTKLVQHTPLTWEFFIYPWDYIIRQITDRTGVDRSFFDNPGRWVVVNSLQYLNAQMVALRPIVMRELEFILLAFWEGTR